MHDDGAGAGYALGQHGGEPAGGVARLDAHLARCEQAHGGVEVGQASRLIGPHVGPAAPCHGRIAEIEGREVDTAARAYVEGGRD
jgi:hypothetical protein